jgi:hypothetical protein
MTDRNDNQPPKVQRDQRPQSGLTDLIHHGHAQSRPMAGTIHADETTLEADAAETWEIEQGTDVLCEDGEKIGEVVDIIPGHLVVEKGFYDPTDLYIPIALVTRHDDVSLSLSITQEDFEERDWSKEPGDGTPES